MSATLATAPSTLLRRPAPAPAMAPAKPMRVHIVGTLLEDAHAATEPATGLVAVTVVVSGGVGPDLVATRWIGDGPEAAICARAIADNLRAGDIVVVKGEGLRMRQRHGGLALHVCTTTHLDLHAEAAGREVAA